SNFILYDTCSCIFFFQAEDGIRDRNVTGVQTCALPISLKPLAVGQRFQRGLIVALDRGLLSGHELQQGGPRRRRHRGLYRGARQIGRASCRERVWSAVGAGGLEYKQRG